MHEMIDSIPDIEDKIIDTQHTIIKQEQEKDPQNMQKGDVLKNGKNNNEYFVSKNSVLKEVGK